MTSAALFLLVLLVGLAVGTVLGYALAVARVATARAGGRDEAASARTDAAQWRARAEELEQRAVLAEERAERDGSVLRALAPVRAQLEQVGSRVEAMERERAAQHATLSEQLRAGARAEEELRRATTALTGALRSRSSRGMWGEVELARVLEASGMLAHVDFCEQRSVASVLAARARDPRDSRAGRRAQAGAGTGSRTEGMSGAGSGSGSGRGSSASRPDVVVHLPGDGFLAVDSKVPMDAYLRAAGLGDADGPGTAESGAGGSGAGGPDDAERRRLLAAHAAALRSHVDALAARGYDRALGASPELVVLFVPAEPVLAAALEADPTLMEHALGKGVALTTPASLLALLRTCASAWARTAVNDDARALLELGRTLYERLGTVAGHLDALGSSLTRSVASYNRTVASLESRLLVSARSLDSLAGELRSPRPVSPEDAQVRALTAPELTSHT